MDSKIKVILTRHAVERLLERRPREYRKITGETIANIIENVIRTGKYLERIVVESQPLKTYEQKKTHEKETQQMHITCETSEMREMQDAQESQETQKAQEAQESQEFQESQESQEAIAVREMQNEMTNQRQEHQNEVEKQQEKAAETEAKIPHKAAIDERAADDTALPSHSSHSSEYQEGKEITHAKRVNIRFSTRKYTVCCRKEGDKLVVTTVINTEEMTESYKNALRYAKPSPFKRVIIVNPSRQIERWIRKWSGGRDMGGQAVQER